MELASLFYGFGMDLDALMVRPEVIGKKMEILAFFYLLFLYFYLFSHLIGIAISGSGTPLIVDLY